MAQATYSFRMDEDLKKEFDDLCCEFGLNTTTAFNVFARAVVRERKIPFELKADCDLQTAKACNQHPVKVDEGQAT